MYFFYCFLKAKLEHNISVQDCRPECTRKDRAKNMANHPKASTIGNIRHVCTAKCFLSTEASLNMSYIPYKEPHPR